MNRSLVALTIAAAAVFAACSGPTGSAIPFASGSGFGSNVILNPHAPPVWAIRHIYAQLNFDGTAFTEVAHTTCGHRGLGGMTPYAAPTSGPLTLAASLSVTPRCVPSTAASPVPQLYIFAIRLHSHHGGHVVADAAHFNGVMIAGPANLTDNPWIFAPTAPGLTMVGGDSYDFVVATLWTHPTPQPSASPTSSP